ncbi:bifunctional nuclease family protein [Muribaculum intestinale]|jgi:bifunctional DNase/RNase|uniref:bifunctional nuclease family protein n=1 Tax=Muribaculum intestinale TaxID=1796646 RepID=UPI0025B0ECE5|nr:bifunctional nuclease domain-containing protein [Muribaculum intestinale]
MESEKIRLKVLGISYSQIQSGAYALILAQADGPYRIPVVIGASEAQSIAIRMEGIIPPRPMTHDLFVSFAHAFGVKLKEVFIYKFEDGIFSSELTFTDGEREVVLDSRTSDAIAIAMRTKSPIFTTRSILDETGFIMEETSASDSDTTDDSTPPSEHNHEEESDESPMFKEPRVEQYSIEELEKTLARLIEQENYEEAARISKIIALKRENDKM